MTQSVGSHLSSIIQGLLDLPFQGDLLDEVYSSNLAFRAALHGLRDLVNQLAHRYQFIDVLEIGKLEEGHVAGVQRFHWRQSNP